MQRCLTCKDVRENLADNAEPQCRDYSESESVVLEVGCVRGGIFTNNKQGKKLAYTKRRVRSKYREFAVKPPPDEQRQDNDLQGVGSSPQIVKQ